MHWIKPGVWGIAIVCVTALFLAGCLQDGEGLSPAPSTPVPGQEEHYTFDQTNDTGTYPVPLDADITLRLPENPTTGYTWQLAVTPGLSITNDTYIPDDPSGRLVGSGGMRQWSMKAVQPGTQEITAAYVRPWESATDNRTTFSMTLVVGSPAQPGTPAGLQVYTEADSGKVVSEARGSEFNIRLLENPTTGYSWNLTTTAGLSMVSDEYIPSYPAGSMMAGGGGIHSFLIKATDTGTQNVNAEYRRPWVPAGTVTHIPLEGGFFGIVGDDGEDYLPLNLDDAFKTDGLRVAFEAEQVKDAVTIQMWGTPVNLTFIEKIGEFNLTVRVE